MDRFLLRSPARHPNGKPKPPGSYSSIRPPSVSFPESQTYERELTVLNFVYQIVQLYRVYLFILFFRFYPNNQIYISYQSPTSKPSVSLTLCDTMSEEHTSSHLDLQTGTPDPSQISAAKIYEAILNQDHPIKLASDSVVNSSPGQQKKKRNRPKKTGKKFKIPIPATGELKTFIDHGSTCDAEGYPIYPNGETVFVREPTDQITNFGHIAYPHTQKTHGAKDGPWKTIWFKCLGVLHCEDDFCEYAAPPPTAEGKAA
ncbi:uncharacterized protein MELLADRAFT_89279 [Melampsora larici-populina 98AG31]|uniref:Uncharacterized protein n=1 Tax=Melampsora larici-populina (strain 98AG31 / pathotype 3-4-7) TaxID=747676 RepID=F4R5K9_MELLP|nr:uncharacterized protein MELLADRAFT_89279 [Melampsora larici-populina 98AG31]EGG12242.1 hypothetical protein MELLADRAFT_89279 [Melampsora larici-populina 98AG31]